MAISGGDRETTEDPLEADAFPLVRFTGASSTRHVAESDGVITFTLALSAASTAVVTATLQASTYMSADMDTAPLVVTFAPGQTTATASLTIYNDAVYEADEVFAIDIVSATNAAVDPAVEGALNVSRLLAVIDYNDVPTGPLVSFLHTTSAGRIAESGGSFNFTLLLSEASSQPVTATVQASSYRAGDMDTSARTFTFQPGQTSISGSIAIYDDAEYEPDEIFALDLVSATNAAVNLTTQSGRSASQLLGYIDNDDAPATHMVRFINASGTQYFSEGLGAIPFTLQLSAPSTQTVSVTVAPSSYMSADLNTAAQTIVFQPGQTTATGQVVIYDDNVFEQDEVFAIEITSVTNAVIDPSVEGGVRVSSILGYLQDNDPPGPPAPDVSVTGPTSVGEGDGSFQISLRFPNVGVLSGTYSYGFDEGASTATYADASVPSGSGSFSVAQSPSGEYVIDLGPVPIIDDALTESAETIAITLTVPGHTFPNGSSTYVHVVTLRDNDPTVGTEGPDTLLGGPGNDAIDGLGGDDSITGADGADLLVGGSGNDILDGGLGGTDTASYADAAGGVTVDLSITTSQDTGAAGSDTLTLIENLTGSAHDDVLRGDHRQNRIEGGAGDDTLYGGLESDMLLGGDGDDLLITNADSSTGRTLHDVFNGGAGVDTIDFSGGGGLPAVDLRVESQGFYPTAPTLISIENVIGGNGDETITGNDVANDLMGMGGVDALSGGLGDDVLDGGLGEDVLYGQAGADVLRDGGETDNRDFLFGGAGNDTYYVTSSLTGPTDLVYEGGDNPDLVAGESDVDVIRSAGEFFWDYYGVGETLFIDRAEGSQMVGGTNSQAIWGNVGNDVILAYGGSNRIDAGGGVDAIGLGLYGLDESFDGANTIVMKAGSGMDYVFDFESGVDKIDLTAFGFGITGAQVLAQPINVDQAGTGNDYCFFYLTSAGGVDNFVVFMGLLSSQLSASDFIT